jgi:hypothetical protein
MADRPRAHPRALLQGWQPALRLRPPAQSNVVQASLPAAVGQGSALPPPLQPNPDREGGDQCHLLRVDQGGW